MSLQVFQAAPLLNDRNGIGIHRLGRQAGRQVDGRRVPESPFLGKGMGPIEFEKSI